MLQGTCAGRFEACVNRGERSRLGCIGRSPADRTVCSARAPNTAREARALPALNTCVSSETVERHRVPRTGNPSKVTLEFHRLGQALQIFPTRNRKGAELSRDGRQQLDVEQSEASLTQMPVQLEQGNLRSVVRAMEH